MMRKANSCDADSLKLLAKLLTEFRDARDWKQFHTQKDLVMALAIEAAELQERMLWKSEGQLDEALDDPEQREYLADEMADVLGYLLLLADRTGIDLGQALRRKVEKNAVKYPVERVKGDSRKYDQY